MNSLQELNGYGSSSLEVTDTRAAGIRYTPNFPNNPQDQVLNITSTSIVVPPGIDITEIVNYSTADVRYRVTIVTGGANPLISSSLTWDSLPAGVSISIDGNQYTLSGIDSIEQWNAVKNVSWTLPSNYSDYPFWFLQSSVIYFDGEADVERTVDWVSYDPDHYYVAEIASSFSLACDAKDVILAQAEIAGAFTPTLNFLRIKRFTCDLNAISSVSAQGQINADNIFAVSNVTALISYQTKGQSTQTATSTLSTSGIILVSNLFDRNYTANNKNVLFSTEVPQVEDDDPATTASFTVTFSSSIGKFAINENVTAITPYSYTGTLSQINAIFSQMLFYPNAGVSSNGSFTFTLQKNAVTQLTRTINLIGNAGTFVGSLYQIGTNTLWTPTYQDITYGVADILLVGGGGGGACLGGGGGGQVLSYSNSTSLNSLTTKTITIGAGGTAGAVRPTGSTADFNGGTGGTTSISGFASAIGGQGGKNDYVSAGNLVYDGGNSGSAQLGGADAEGTETVGGNDYIWRSGGGGAGDAGPGGAASISAGGSAGNGTGSGITGFGQTFGAGGKGALLRGATNFGENGVAGAQNTGNGGGGGSGFLSGAGTQSGVPIERFAAAGGSGIVIIKFHA